MRKLLATLLAVVMLLGVCGTAFAATETDTLVIGTPKMNGDFVGGFGNSAYDASIKRILHGYYDTVISTSAGEYVVNPTVVKEYSAELDAEGNKVYTFTLYDDLLWSDGSMMTAQDFVFGLLYAGSKAWAEAGASTTAPGYGLVGYKDYNDGTSDTFAGVKLIDEYSYTITIDKNELPYFYEITYVGLSPAPMSVYAPNMELVSDETGCKLIGKGVDQEVVKATRAAYVAPAEPKADEYLRDENYAVLLKDLQNVAATERFAPTVVSGPYKFISFENQAVTLEINEYFKGNFEGKKPTIKYVVQKYVPQDTDVDGVIAGDVDMINGVIEGDKIEAAKASDTAKTHSYFRNGYGYLAMHCDWGVTQDANVRWALGYLIDRNAVIDHVLGGYGGTVQAEYGFAQWMYEEAGDELEELLTPFNLNLAKANECLDLTEWRFEADGKTPFDASKALADGTYMRHNEKGEMLIVRHLGTTDNKVTDIIEIQYTANAPMAGVKFEVTKSDFDALLNNFYYGYQLGDDRIYNTFNLATSFDAAFDPYLSGGWHSDFFGSWENSCQLSDAELDGYIMALRSCEATDKDGFIEQWLKYEKRWQDLLPQIPLYSNEYYDIFSTRLDGVNTTPFATWDRIVCDITKADTAVTPAG